ncbi:hypothetical protein Hanom_Chr17g01571781 [Helianthus anomalus]
MYTDSWNAYNCFISFIFSSTCWFFENIPIPSIFSESSSPFTTGERSPFLESEELESSEGKKEVKAKLVSYSYAFFHIIGEHVFGHAFIVIEQFKKKLGSH